MRNRSHLAVAPSPEQIGDALVAAAEDEKKLRPSISVRTAAETVRCDISTIYRALAAGDLEGHRLGKRARRVFVDSFNAWQAGGPGKAAAKPTVRTPDRRQTGAHKAAMARLKGAGVW